MLPNEGGDPELMKSIQEDLDMINQLITETLSIGLELEGARKTQTDIAQELRDIVNNFSSSDVEITLSDDAGLQPDTGYIIVTQNTQ